MNCPPNLAPTSLLDTVQRLHERTAGLADKLAGTGDPPTLDDLAAAVGQVTELKVATKAAAVTLRTLDDLAADLLTRPRR